VQYGYIEAIKPVRLEGTKTPIGTLAGAGVGGVAGSAIGQGRGSVIGAIAGAVIGGVAGAAAEEGLTRRQGVQLTIRLEGRHRDWYEGQYRHRYAEGRTIAVVQQVSPDVHYRIGDRVQVLTSRNGQTRVDVVN
jgi:outer membrane lipoprotein SlyB